MVAVAACRGWAYFDPEYESLNATLNPPRVVIDNAVLGDATVIKLDSTNRHGILLEIVQALTDLDLFITKAYVSSDGDWFMDVFHLTDHRRKKITDEATLKRIQETLEKKAGVPLLSRNSSRRSKTRYLVSESEESSARVSMGSGSSQHTTTIELTGPDRPGLLSEVFSALASLGCSVSSAEVWTQNLRVACLIFVENGVDDEPELVLRIQNELCGIMRAGDTETRSLRTDLLSGLTHTERRLHQMMSAHDNDDGLEDAGDDELLLRRSGTAGEQTSSPSSSKLSALPGRTTRAPGSTRRPAVSIRNCVERGYSVVNIHCRDRSKLLFDTVCTLTDMDYMIFHATVLSEGCFAYQEFYIRHVDGCTLETDEQRQRLVKRLVAAIERRFTQGLKLELYTSDRVGLLSDVTRVFYRHGLSVTRAYVSTSRSGKVANTFYVTDGLGGGRVSRETVERVRAEIGEAVELEVHRQEDDDRVGFCQRECGGSGDSWNDCLETSGAAEAGGSSKFSLGSFFRAHSERLLYNLGLISAPAAAAAAL